MPSMFGRRVKNKKKVAFDDVKALVTMRRVCFLLKWSKVKVKFFPYSLPSVGPGADPGVQAVSPQVT